MSLSSQQIVTLACQIAKVPGYTAQAGQLLNSLLTTLCEVYDFDYTVKRQVIPMSSSAASYPLNSDHLRTRQVFYLINGASFDLNQIPIERYNTLFQGPGVANYPYSYAIDVSKTPMVILPYPPPNTPISVNVDYYPLMPDIVSPETNNNPVWFTNTDELIKVLSAQLMMITDDERLRLFMADAKEIMSKYLTKVDDKDGYAQTIKLDRTNFRSRSGLSPTKAFPLD